MCLSTALCLHLNLTDLVGGGWASLDCLVSFPNLVMLNKSPFPVFTDLSDWPVELVRAARVQALVPSTLQTLPTTCW